MFTLGKTYEFTIWANGGHHNHVGEAIEIAMPLVKFRDETGAEAIVNTHSAAFVGAKVSDGARG
jgi:hypothetical protein